MSMLGRAAGRSWLLSARVQCMFSKRARAPVRDPAIWCLAVAETVIWGGTLYLFPALFPRWEADLGWSKPELAATFTAALVVSALLSPSAGKIIDRGHGRALLVGAAVLASILLIALSQTHSQPVFVALWLGLGACMAGALYDPCFAFLVRSRAEHARQAITLVTLVAGFAGTLSFPLNTYISEWSDWRTATLVYAALVLCIAVPCFWRGTAMPDSGAVVGRTTRALPADTIAFRKALRNHSFWLIALGFALIYLNHGTVLTHLLPMLSERGVSLDYAVFAIAIIGPSQVAGRIAMMAIERWLSIRFITVASAACIALAALCLTLVSYQPALLIAFAVLQGSGVGVSSITRPIVTEELLGRAAYGAIAGAISLPVLLAMAFAPSTGAGLWAYGGYSMVFGVNLWLALAATVLLAIAAWPRQQRPTPT
jgi:predicted MFS family arabinose efflux permease